MSNYSKTTDFEAKDSLPTGDSGKIIRGSEFETEFDAISTAIATKADTAGPTFTGTLTFETISDGTINVTAFVDEDNMASNSATLVPTQQSVKAYVDSQLTAQDLDFQADSGGALSIDLDSETMTFTGGTGIDTSGSGNAVTFAIDSTVATLAGSQTLTNKSLTAPTLTGTAVVASLDISGNIDVDGTTNLDVVDIDGAVDFASTTAHAGNASFADNARAIFGAGSDLQIYHSGSHSFIEDAGTGNLKIKTNTLRIENAAGTELSATFVQDGAVTLYNDNSIKLATTSTGIDVTGTVTADGLTVESAADAQIRISDSTSANQRLDLEHNAGVSEIISGNNGAFGSVKIQAFNGTSTVDRLQIKPSGDIEFYEDTGTTAKFFFDASTERLGLGTSSPATTLSVEGSSANGIELNRNGADATSSARLFFDSSTNCSSIFNSGGNLVFATGATPGSASGTERVRIDSSGRVGIGTTSPTRLLHVRDTSSQTVAIFDGAANSAGEIGFRASGTSGDTYVTIGAVANDMVLSAGANERVRIDSSGRVGIGTSNPQASLHTTGSTIIGTSTTGASYEGVVQIADGAVNGRTILLMHNNHTDQFIKIGQDVNTALIGRDNADELAFGVFDNAADTTLTKQMVITSSGNVGVGTDSPGTTLHVNSGSVDAGIRVESSDASSYIEFKDNTTTTNTQVGGQGDALAFRTGGSEAMRIDSSGNLLVGTTATSVSGDGARLMADGQARFAKASDAVLLLNRNTTDGNIAEFRKDNATVGSIASVGGAGIKVAFSSDGDQYITGNAASNYLSFSSANAERVRIDSDGRLLVGLTSAFGAGGTTLSHDGQVFASRADNPVILATRENSDGEIMRFRKDSSAVGSIGVNESDLYIGTGDTTLRFADGADSIVPRGTNGATRDAAVALGNSANRFSNLTLSGGVFLGGTTTANKLDDYEEGTFTPVVADASSGGNTATGTFSGRYTKVGNLVCVQLVLTNIDTTGLTAGNQLFVRDLPFTTVSGNFTNSAPYTNNVTFNGYLTSVLGSSRTFLYFQDNNSGSGNTNLIVSEINSGVSDIALTTFYEAV